MLFEGKWTFLRVFSEKVDFFACFWGESGPFCVYFWVKVDFFARFLGESGLILPKLWTIWLRAWFVGFAISVHPASLSSMNDEMVILTGSC